MQEVLTQSWTWWFSGMVIAGIMFLLLFFGKTFGFSSNMRTICSMAGAGKKVAFFDFDWKSQVWNLIFLVGAAIGGWIAGTFMNDHSPVAISANTIQDLSALGMSAPTSLQPDELFGWDAVLSLRGFSFLALGGLMVGFGSRYAGGCTSGHAISGLSNFQFPSLLAVIGFFAGGLLMTHVIFPFLF
jgi:uncharacterized membrane protein YedE/YeeE